VRLIDWLPGATPHKLEFASGVRPLLRLRLFSSAGAGVLERGLATAVSTARERTRRRLSEERRTQIRRTLGIDRVRAPAPTGPPTPRDGGTA
jgi:hypothetical protein